VGEEQRVVVVTGASRGIGAALVAAFRDRGYQVVATSRSIKPTTDPDLVAVPGDIADPDTAEKVISAAVSQFGRVDTLVNNAGIFIMKPFTDYTDEDFSSVMKVNVAGFYHISQRAVDVMLKQASGHIINITTSLVDQADVRVPSVLTSLSKGGLNSATKSLAIEYAERGIRVNAVSLGNIKTSMHPAETHESLAKMHPVGRMGEVSDIVTGVLYLESAPFVTGEILHIDGGQSAGH
jgi:Dehydrogenases with different specificities (related to short-chain alcohol dehydrogenases)